MVSDAVTIVFVFSLFFIIELIEEAFVFEADESV